MKALILATFLAAHAPQWFCFASDNQGAVGQGVGPSREAAESQAFLNCQNHSHGSCSIQSCSSH